MQLKTSWGRINNQSSHHNEEDGTQTNLSGVNAIAKLMSQLLDLTESIIGEMPWHMKTSFVYGEQPKVLSGEAWSHSSPTPRLMRVLEWTGRPTNSNITFWNSTRQNPIVPNPIFIARPKKQ